MFTNLTKKLGAGVGVLVAVAVSFVVLAPASAGETETECVGSYEEDVERNVVTSFSPNCRHRPLAKCESPDGPDGPFGEVAWFTTPTFNPPGVPSDGLGGVSVACPTFSAPDEFQDYVLLEGAVELQPVG